MNDQEAYDFYAGPENRRLTGTPGKRRGQRLTATSSVRFPPEVIEAVKGVALAEGVTVGSWIRRLVDRELGRHRPAGLIEGSGRKGHPRILTSSRDRGRGYGSTISFAPSPAGVTGTGRTFCCPHMSVGNALSAACGQCGPLEPAA